VNTAGERKCYPKKTRAPRPSAVTARPASGVPPGKEDFIIMQPATGSFVHTLLGLPLFRSEWVLYLLLGLSVISVGVMLERWIFFRRRRIDLHAVHRALAEHVAAGDFVKAARALAGRDALETNVVLAGLGAHAQGPESVEDLIAGTLGREKGRYEKRLGFLATLASNAPYIGLFGTVLGIVRSFRDLAGNMADASSAVMAGIAEALVATAVGLLVAIPAVVAFNVFKGKVRDAVTDCQMLARVLLAQLKAVETDGASARGE
jgi:biopolymer transport protein ExbB